MRCLLHKRNNEFEIFLRLKLPLGFDTSFYLNVLGDSNKYLFPLNKQFSSPEFNLRETKGFYTDEIAF